MYKNLHGKHSDKVMIFDEADADIAYSFNWYGMEGKRCGHQNNIRAAVSIYSNGKCKTVLFHRLILEKIIKRKLNQCEITDHINRNPLDNRRGNLRVCNHYQNNINTCCKFKNTSGFKGVTRHKHKWEGNLKFKKKRIIGQATSDKKEAAIVYDCIAYLLLDVDFAYFNFPEKPFGHKWIEIGHTQRKQILHSLELHGLLDEGIKEKLSTTFH
jgi:hypothetical protein